MTSDSQVKSPKISIIVDYAHEPESMKQLLSTLINWKKQGYFDCIIHIVSCDGVGRDDAKKPILGKISHDLADYSIITTDNYGKLDDPIKIVDMISSELPQELEGVKYSKTIDRKQAFEYAMLEIKKLSTTSNQDQNVPNKFLVVSTGVGSENGLSSPEGTRQWNEAQIWQEVFTEYFNAG